jgi:hypothetical protein
VKLTPSNTPLPRSTGDEDTALPVTLQNLLDQGNEADVEGSVTAFVVKAVSSGTLTINGSAWNASSNNTIDSSKAASWTPASNANGTLSAFTVVAKDNVGAESSTATQVQVTVTAVNDLHSGVPSLSGNAIQGQVLTASTGTLADADGLSPAWQWQVSSDGSSNWTAISGATSTTYTLAASEAGKYVRVQASWGTGSFAESEVSSSSVGISSAIALPLTHDVVKGTNANDAPVAFDVSAATLVTQSYMSSNYGNDVSPGMPDNGYFAANTDHPAMQLASFNSSGNNAYKILKAGSSGTGSVAPTDLQNMEIANGNYRELHIIAGAGDVGSPESAGFTVTLMYTDATTSVSSFTVPDWYGSTSGSGYSLISNMDRFRLSGGYENVSVTDIFGLRAPVDFSKILDKVSITANFTSPDSNNGMALVFLGGEATPSQYLSNDAPIISSNSAGATAAITVSENTTAVTTVRATDNIADTLTYSLSGTDASKFTINASTGVLAFTTAPNYEAPTDSDANNVYSVRVTATDNRGLTDLQTLSVTVTDVAETVDSLIINGVTHYYRISSVLADSTKQTASWTNAQTYAAADTYQGLPGYLATITSATENNVVLGLLNGKDSWLGASDAANEGAWNWVTGPERGTQFFNDTGSGGTTPSSNYINWYGSEPNNSTLGNSGGQDYGVMYSGATNQTTYPYSSTLDRTPGTWDDAANLAESNWWNTAITGGNLYYVIEYSTNYLAAAPITIDLTQNGLGFTPLSSSSTAAFDFNNDNIPDQTAWVAADDGILAIDINADDLITQRAEIVFTDYAPEAKSDMEALQLAFDSNHDGSLTAEDARWQEFGIWQDSNVNGVNEAGEFKSLDEWGITQLGLVSNGQVSSPVNGVIVSGESTVVFADQHTTTAADVVFTYLPETAATVAPVKERLTVNASPEPLLKTLVTTAEATPQEVTVPWQAEPHTEALASNDVHFGTEAQSSTQEQFSELHTDHSGLLGIA